MRAAAFALAVALSMPQSAGAGQAAPSPAARETLNRVGADLFSATPHPAEAIKELQAILAAEPNVADAHLLLGIAYRVQGAPELMGEAIAELRQALALNPSLVLARLTLARVYLDMARAARARDELATALAQVPGHPQLLALLGEAERRLGNPRRSAELNRQALEADGSFVQARYYLALALLDLRQHADAIQEMKLVVQSGANQAEAHVGLGTAYLDAGRLDEGLAALREAARIDPSRADTQIQLSRAYRLKGQPDEAAKALKVAAASAPAGLNALYHGAELDLYMEEGLVRMQQGRLEAAAESFHKVLAADANHVAAKAGLAEVRKRLKDPARRKNPGKPS